MEAWGSQSERLWEVEATFSGWHLVLRAETSHGSFWKPKQVLSVTGAYFPWDEIRHSPRASGQLLLAPPLSCAHWVSLTQSPVAGGRLHVSSVVGNRPGRNDVLLQNSPREPPFWTDDLQREGASFRSPCVPPRVGSPSDSVQCTSSPFISTQRKGRASGETGA